MKHLADIKGLTELYLVETAVTIEGLKHLDLNRLKKLHLEGHIGGPEFGNDALKPLEGSKQLEELTLYGVGFDAAAIELFKNMPKLRKLRLLDTQIPAGVESLLYIPGRYLKVKGKNIKSRVYAPGRRVNVSTE